MNRRVLVPTATLLVAAVLAGLGTLLYSSHQHQRSFITVVDPGEPAVAFAHVVAQRFDANAQRIELRVDVVPLPGNADQRDPEAFARELTIRTSSPSTPMLRYQAGQRTAEQTLLLPIFEGPITDYPVDRYTTTLELAAEYSGEPVALRMDFSNTETLFDATARTGGSSGAASFLELSVTRSPGTLVLAWFMVAAMWALVLVVAGAAAVLIIQRRGLVWPALGWMAATLFALVGLRNAAPGSPPIGSLIDYAAFFWAEALIAIALVAAVLAGIAVDTQPKKTSASS